MIYQHANLQVAWRGSEGLTELVLAAPGSVNKFDRDTLTAFGEAIATLSHTPGIRGLLIHSSKEAFVVGADITEFLGLFRLPKEELLGWLARANAIFNQRVVYSMVFFTSFGKLSCAICLMRSLVCAGVSCFELRVRS